MSHFALPSERLCLATNYAHSPSLLEKFVAQRLLALDGIFVPVRIGPDLHIASQNPPFVVPSDVVAVLIKQAGSPSRFGVEESPTGYVVKERDSGRPEEYYVLFNSTKGGRRCTIETWVEVRYFYYTIRVV